MLSDEETREIKQKILSHVESTFPVEQIENTKQQIEAMNSSQLEVFLKRNKILKKETEESSDSECVFCSIVSGKINSVKIDENENAIAILEINPISKGHTLVIPKIHADKAAKRIHSFAKKISKKLKKKLHSKEIEISDSNLFGHAIINLIPIYENENLQSKRSSARIEELEKVKEELEKKPEKVKKPKKEKKQFFWLPKRIP